MDHNFKIVAFASQHSLGDIDEGVEDVKYWLSRSVRERLEAVTFLISQSITKGERLDKTIVTKGKLKQ